MSFRDYVNAFYYDDDWNQKHQVIKKDPYRYILSEKEEKKCYHRVKRLLFVCGIPALYIYKHRRYHQELSRVRQLKFSLIQMLEIVPRVVVSVVILYPLSNSFFYDYDKLKSHQIAKYELQKFDPDWFNYDEYKYVLHNAPVYDNEDSVWGHYYLRRLPFSYFQTAGWIKRRRDENSSIENETPPKYDFTPKGPREGTNFKEIENKPLSFI